MHFYHQTFIQKDKKIRRNSCEYTTKISSFYADKIEIVLFHHYEIYDSFYEEKHPKITGSVVNHKYECMKYTRHKTIDST